MFALVCTPLQVKGHKKRVSLYYNCEFLVEYSLNIDVDGLGHKKIYVEFLWFPH